MLYVLYLFGMLLLAAAGLLLVDVARQVGDAAGGLDTMDVLTLPSTLAAAGAIVISILMLGMARALEVMHRTRRDIRRELDALSDEVHELLQTISGPPTVAPTDRRRDPPPLIRSS